MNQGAFDFTTKPINLEDLERTIEKAAEQIAFIKQAQREHTQLESIQNDLHVAQEIQPNNPAQDIPSVSGVEIVRLVCLYERSQICRRGFL